MDDDGCLFLIDMDNQEIYLSTSGTMMEYLTDHDVESILDDAFEQIIDGDYYGTFDTFFVSTGEVLEQKVPEESLPQEDYLNEDPVYEEMKGGSTEEQDVVIENLMEEEQTVNSASSFDYSPVIALFLAIIAAFFTRRTIIGNYQMKFVDRDYENDAYSNAKLKVYDKEDRLINTFVNSRRIEPRPMPREEYHSRPVYHNDRVEPERPSRRPSSRPHGGGGRSFDSSHSSGSSRSHGGGGRSFSGSSRSSGGGRSFSGSSGSRSGGGGGRSHGGGGRKF